MQKQNKFINLMDRLVKRPVFSIILYVFSLFYVYEAITTHNDVVIFLSLYIATCLVTCATLF